MVETPSRPKGEQMDTSITPTTTPIRTKVIATITPVTEANGSSFITPRVDKGKSIARDIDDLPLKLITQDELQAHLDKKEQMEKAAKDVELSKLKIMRIAVKVVNELHNEKLKKKVELRKKRPVTVTVYRNNDPINFEVLREFKFSDCGLSEWDELNAILPKKSNKYVSEMITSLSKRYERLKEIPNETGLDLTLPLPEQDHSLPKRKRKAIKLEPETYIVGFHYNRTLLKRLSDINIVDTETLLFYKAMNLNVKTAENQRSLNEQSFSKLPSSVQSESMKKDLPFNEAVDT
ncbi:hypothetical protein Tco_1446201, partial [Tanacetum coccineum]